MTDISLPSARRVALVQPLRPFVDVVRSPRHLATRRLCLAVVLVTVAFHYSLSTLLRTVKSQTPLAYLGLVPFIALLLAAARVRPRSGEPPIHDRQVDYIIAMPMLLCAVAFELFMPIRLSTLFWLYRMDLLALPLFVAGTITLLFGTRTLWRLKIAVGFLILAWPLPYTTFLVNWLNAFTGSTLHGLNAALRVAHVAMPDPAQGTGMYLVKHGLTSFTVSVASACSGVNGVVGFFLVAIAFLAVVSGRWTRKVAWLFVGLVGVWCSNIVRILIILAAGQRWGERMAIGILHPYMGLLTFSLVVLAMVALMGPFGLDFRPSKAHGGLETLSRGLRQAVPTVRLATSLLVGLVVVAFLLNSTLRSFDLVVSSLGAPRLVAFSQSPPSPQGWTVQQTNVYTWATPFFGEDSTWNRYQYSGLPGSSSPLKSQVPIVSDVINTSDLSSFSTYGIEACYRFHGYKLHSIRTVDLGNGVTGNVLSYYNPSQKSDWTTVYWHWPVKATNGKTRYERITLMLLNTGGADFTGPRPSTGLLRSLGISFQNALAGKASGGVDAKLNRTRTFLVEFARTLIEGQALASTGRTAVAKSATHLASAGR
jgi:exosortase/archaeosortase family protein